MSDDGAIAEELLPSLRDVVAEFDSQVIVAANSGITDQVVATAWNRLKAYDGVAPELREFIATYRNRGPERVACEIA